MDIQAKISYLKERKIKWNMWHIPPHTLPYVGNCCENIFDLIEPIFLLF